MSRCVCMGTGAGCSGCRPKEPLFTPEKSRELLAKRTGLIKPRTTAQLQKLMEPTILGIPIKVDRRAPPGFIGLVNIPKWEPFRPLADRIIQTGSGPIPVKAPIIEVFVFCAPDAVWRLYNLDDRRRGAPTDSEGWEG